jgi:succinoglycan biosynthesis protein ExoV
MYQHKTDVPNFGDELNGWMWPRLLGDMFDDDERELFLGIGSILYDWLPKESTKIVFGAGYGGYTAAPTIDPTWRVYFVRGKLTASTLGLDPKLAIGDAAILVRGCLGPAPQKRHKVSFIPHWESTLVGAWPQVCARAEINYIDPCASVDSVLDDIRASELVITEAMHGAIVSDAARVPWIGFQPIRVSHRMKWNDWASALDLRLRLEELKASTLPEYLSGRMNSFKVSHWMAGPAGAALGLTFRRSFIDRAARQLSAVATHEPSLSSAQRIEDAHGGMLQKLVELKHDFGNRQEHSRKVGL